MYPRPLEDIIDIVKLAGLILGFLFAQLGQAPSQPPLPGANAGGYRLAWSRHFHLQSGLSPCGVAEDRGALWLVTHAGPGKPDELTRIDSEGQLTGSYEPKLPLKLIERIAYLSPATSGPSAGLLASLASGGREQTFEGAFFMPVGPKGWVRRGEWQDADLSFPRL